jgi:hypothetical protein
MEMSHKVSIMAMAERERVPKTIFSHASLGQLIYTNK